MGIEFADVVEYRKEVHRKYLEAKELRREAAAMEEELKQMIMSYLESDD